MDLARSFGQVVVVVGVLHGVGWLLLRLAGIPSGWAVTAAAPTTWGLIGLAATFQSQGGAPAFSLLNLGLLVAALAIVLVTGRMTVRRSGARRRDESCPRPSWILAASVTSLAVAFGVMAWATGGDFTVASQTWDAPFHVNTIRHVAESGVANPNTIASLVSPAAPYYPAGFSSIGALVMLLTGCGAVEASNIAAVALAGSLWPGAVMTGVALGLRWTTPWVAVAGVLAVTNWGMPWSPLGWGVLWPTAAGAAYAPIVLGALLAARRHVPWLTWVPIGLGGLAAAFAMHPRAIVLLGAQILVILVWWLIDRVVNEWRNRTAGGYRRVGLSLLLLGTLVGGSAVAAVAIGRGAKFAAIDWSTDETPLSAFAAHLSGSSPGGWPTGLVSILAILGLVYAWRRRDLRWVAFSWTVLVLVDILTASVRSRWLSVLTRLWYNDRYRSVTMVAFASIILAVIGLRRVGRYLARRHRATWWQRRPWSGLVVAAIVVASLPSGAAYLNSRYAGAAHLPGRALVAADQRAFYAEVGKLVPQDEFVLNNAADGSSMLFAYEGVHVVFQAIGANGATQFGDELQRTLVTSTDRAGTCAKLDHDRIRWVLAPHVSLDRLSVAPLPTPGIEIPENFSLTTLVHRDATGRLRLYRITGCPQ